jgi:hypothetical protein
MAHKIQLRRDTAANWALVNPTPALGEPCIETDTGVFKFGDGVTQYSSLPPVVDPGAIQGGYTFVQSLSVDGSPVSPVEGNTWFDPDVGKTYLYYNDGVSTTWVQSGIATGEPGPDGPVGPEGPQGPAGTGVTLEEVQDNLGTTSLVAGTGLSKTYDDVANTITLAVINGGIIASLDTDLATFSVPASTTISAFGASLVDDADAAAARATLGVIAAFADPNADRIVFWDDSAGAWAALSPTAPVTISGTALSVAAASESAQGIVELATTAEATTGTDTARAVTPAGLAAAAVRKVAAGASIEDIGAIESNVQTVAATGATETLDTSIYGAFDMTMDQNCTFTFSNPAPSGKMTAFTLILRGAFTPTFPASVDWPDGTLPTYATPSVYTFMTVNAGTTWLGAQAGKAFA